MNAIDWDIVKNFIKEYNPESVVIGMAQDWYHTAQTVYEDGEWKDLKGLTKISTWANPWLEGNFKDGSIRKISCSKEATQADIDAAEQERNERRIETREFIKKLREDYPSLYSDEPL
jgi:hypothetical protein